MQPNKIIKGKLLISYPSSNGNDNIFSRSVILITESGSESTIGFILNKPLTNRLNELIPSIKKDYSVYAGGPVEVDKIFFIHNVPDLIHNSISITKNLFWGGNFEELVELINTDQIHQNNICFFLGYSGWDCKQLENEIDNKYWILDDRDFNINIFDQLQPEIWKNHIKELGGKYLIWVNSPENPELN